MVQIPHRYHNCTTGKSIISDIKTSVNETKQQSTRIGEEYQYTSSITHSTYSGDIVPDTCCSHKCVYLDCMNRCRHGAATGHWQNTKHCTWDMYIQHNAALKCSKTFNPLLLHVDLQKICLYKQCSLQHQYCDGLS